MIDAQELRNRKALATTTLIVVLFAVCWIPHCFYVSTVYLLRELGVISLNMQHNDTEKIIYLILLLNSFLDPFIYAARMREIQRGEHHLLFRLITID